MPVRITITALVVAVFALSLPSQALAQQHVVPAAVLSQAVANQVATDQQNRAVVLRVLHRSQVKELAGRLGLSVTHAEDAVATLNSAELARVAGPAQLADVQLAGGSDPIVISVTTLLLIIIIVILIAR